MPHLERAHFKGGEPFLSSEAQRVWADMLELSPQCSVSVVTNATQSITQPWALVADLRMDVTVSVDAVDRSLYEAIRVGASFDQMMQNLDRLQAVTEATGRT